MESIYTYFKDDKEIIDATFIGIKNLELKQNFVKRWGRELEGNSKYFYTEKDQQAFLKYKKIFNRYLKYTKTRYENGYSLDQIIESLRTNTTLPFRLPIYQNREDLSDKLHISFEQLEDLLGKINLQEKLAFTYYIGLDRPKMNLVEISKLLDCDVELAKNYIIKTDLFLREEASIIENKNNLIPKNMNPSFQKNASYLIEKSKKRTRTKGPKKKTSFLGYFEEEENRKIKHDQELNTFYTDHSTSYDPNINMQKEESVILNAILNQHMTVKEIHNTFGILEKTIDFYLIQNLHLFQEDMIPILVGILKRHHYSTIDIIQFSYLKKEMENLTDLEKIYFYLKLESYHNPFLTNTKIAKILNLSLQEINTYQIMTKSDQLNMLNKLFVKK